MQARCFAIVVTSLMLSRGSLVKADYIVASNYPPADPDSNVVAGVGIVSQIENYNNLAVGQSFTPTANGVLTTVETQISGAVEVPVPKTSPELDVSLFEAINNSPTVLLATVKKQATDFQSWSVRGSHRYAVDFSQLQIPLTAGEQYFVAFQTPIGVPGSVEIWSPYLVGVKQSLTSPFPPPSLGSYASVAPNGNDWQIDPNTEVELAIHAIPEPTSFCLLASVALGCALLRSIRWKAGRFKDAQAYHCCNAG